ncbi:sacsin N-terminal ATP-binding-like domain-containing protein [Streptomonospora nanhaiensis]|uniref:sacsin N-terminal ATP-binding-like domain-containing protein n=1 Tax=Streptomonospora nanhaiensis TaxID=1323731 RepID=UPI001C992C68|nr:ATP-binding protein [Streptomonospora nanhaiensis]MBX9391495.1 ATP-binding protein [Streptomonospora nanhaiensis]
MAQTHTDPFGTAELRRRVLAGWADAPARFREDANAEEDFALGGYRDRVVVELAQNAADAALRAGAPGRLRLELRGDRLTAANTGAPLTAAGVESLSTLRASAKRDESAPGATGRFGVGFAAVAAYSDDITVASADGAVRWSADLARDTVRTELLDPGRAPGLAGELERRGGHVPLLRLPFPADTRPPAGYDTEVALTARDPEAADRLRALLDHTGPALLLALPGLAEVRIATSAGERLLTRESAPEGDVLTRVAHLGPDGAADPARTHTVRWRTAARTGRFDPDLLADRPTEERDRLDWSLTWAVPVTAEGAAAALPAGVPGVVHAPTPTDDRLAVPALLIGTFPLGADRRRVAAGPVAEALIAEAAAGYCELLCRVEPRSALDLVPPALPGQGEFDARFRAAVAKPLVDTPFLTTAEGEPVRPRDAVVLDGGPEVVAALAGLVTTALPGDLNTRHPALAQLRVRRLGLAELADLLSDLDRDPAWWARLYAALRAAGQRGADLGELGALPVPLVDGRLVRGPRGLLVPSPDDFGDGLDLAALAPLGLRIVHPEAADPLLERLGAVAAGPAAVLADPRTRAAVEHSLDADDPDLIAAPVLELVAMAQTAAADSPWLAELALRDDEGGYSVAGELLLPTSPLRDIFVPDAPFGVVADDLVDRYGAGVLGLVGVLDSFAVVRAADLTLGPDSADLSRDPRLEGLNGLEEWAEDVAERLGDPDLPPVVTEFAAVADLEFVRDDRWPQALELLSGPLLRDTVTTPARVLGGGGRVADVPPYTAWWLRTGAVLAGRRPTELRTADAEPVLADLYDPAPEGLDPYLAAALGVRSTLADLLADPDGPDDLLERMADPDRHVARGELRALWTALAEVDADRVAPPERVRALRGGAIVLADPEDTVVVDLPELLPLLADRPLVLAPAWAAPALADVLDLALASEEVEGRITSIGEVRPVPAEVAAFVDTGAHTYVHHDELTVDNTPTEWFCEGTTAHASTPEGLARALCRIAGRWADRHLVAAVLRDPDALPVLLAEADLD